MQGFLVMVSRLRFGLSHLLSVFSSGLKISFREMFIEPHADDDDLFIAEAFFFRCLSLL